MSLCPMFRLAFPHAQRHARVSKTRLRHDGGHPRHRATWVPRLAWVPAFARMTSAVSHFASRYGYRLAGDGLRGRRAEPEHRLRHLLRRDEAALRIEALQ